MSKEQEEGKPYNVVFSKTCNRTKITFRGKPLLIRNNSHQYTSSHHHQNQRDLSPLVSPNKFIESEISNRSSPETMDNTCTLFMRNYIDKLKRQRKREKKKIDCFNHSKQNHITFGNLGCEKASLPSIPNHKTFISKQIHPLAFRSNSLQHPTNNPEIDRFVQIIRGMKQYDKHTRGHSLGLPILANKPRKSKQYQNIEIVDPWQNAVDYQQSVFEQYK